MSAKTLRRIWFLGLWLLVPWPLSIFAEVFAPAARYAVLGGAATAVAIAEGAAGPVGLITLLFVGMAVATTLGCWIGAWAIARLLSPLPSNARSIVTWVALGVGLLVALAFHPYDTPMGRAPRGNLLDVLS